MSIRKNTVINLAGSIIPMFVMLVTVPLYLKVLGDARYGVLALVWLVLGYFSFLEMGLGKATANQIAKAHDAPAAERSEIFWTALFVNGAMGVVGAGILWLVGHYLLTSVLKMPEDFRQEAIAALPWMAATFPLALASSVLNGALEGRNQFLTVNVLQITGNVVFQVAPLGVAYALGPSLEWVIPAAVISRALMNLPVLLACQRAVLQGTGIAVSLRRVRSLLGFGGWVAISGIVGMVLETLDRFVVGATLGAQAVPAYVIPFQLAAKLRVIPSALTRALFPRFSSQMADPELLALSALNALAVVMTPVVILSTLLLKPFMNLWVGPDVAAAAVPVGYLFVLGVWMNSMAFVPLIMLQGIGKPDWVAKIHSLELLPFIVVLYLAIQQLGLYGAALAWVLRAGCDAMLIFMVAKLLRRAARLLLIPAAMVLVCNLLVAVEMAQWVFYTSVVVLIVWVAIWFASSDIARALLAEGMQYVTRLRSADERNHDSMSRRRSE